MTTIRTFKTLALILAFSVTACGSSGGGDTTASGLNLVKDGTLTVCSDVPYAPFEDFDKSAASGFKGFDVDIVSEVAKKLKLKLVIKDSDFNALQSGLALNAGDCDVAASAMTITPARAKKIGFTEGYYDSDQSLLVPTDSAISKLSDLDGKKVGVQTGTTGEAYTKKNAPKADATGYSGDGPMFQSLKAEQIVGILQDLPVNLNHTKDGKFKIVETYPTDESYGLAVAKKNTALLKKVNDALAELKSSGDYQKIYDSYFKTS